MRDDERLPGGEDLEQRRAVEDDELYKELIERGDSKEKAARIASIARSRPCSKGSSAER